MPQWRHLRDHPEKYAPFGFVEPGEIVQADRCPDESAFERVDHPRVAAPEADRRPVARAERAIDTAPREFA